MKNFTQIVIVAAICLYCCPAYSQVITTIAGNGSIAYFGDGGPATASTGTFFGVGADGAGNLYISDRSGHRIRKIDASGTISLYGGTSTAGFLGEGTPATDAEFQTLNGVYVDNPGNVFIADGPNSRIRKIDLSGMVHTVIGSGSGGYSGDGGPATNAQISDAYGVTTDMYGNLYLADSYNNRIRKVDATGVIHTIAGVSSGIAGFSGDSGPATNAMLSWPTSVVVDNAGNVIFTDDNNNRIRKIDPSGMISTVAGVGPAGTVPGAFTGSLAGDGGPATSANLNLPVYVALDGCGNIYFTDDGNNCVRRISTAGIITRVAGTGTSGVSGDGGPATAATLYHPVGITFDAMGNLIVCDNGNSRVRRISNVYSVPSFVAGASYTLSLCVHELPGSINLDSALRVADPGLGETEVWSLIAPPTHGVATTSYTTTTTGGTLVPSGLTYIPVSGYTGRDTFKVRTTNCAASDTITIYITLTPFPVVGPISGMDSFCIYWPTYYYDSTPGGVWTSSNPTMASIGGTSGVVTGYIPGGVDTISYTVSVNGCATTVTKRIFGMYIPCEGAVGRTPSLQADMLIIQPNPNKGDFVLSVTSASGYSANITVTNLLGQKVFEQSCPTNRQISVQLRQPPGTYLLNCTTSEGTAVKRIVVE